MEATRHPHRRVDCCTALRARAAHAADGASLSDVGWQDATHICALNMAWAPQLHLHLHVHVHGIYTSLFYNHMKSEGWTLMLLAAVIGTAASLVSEDSLAAQFADWQLAHGRKYTSAAEVAARFSNFVANSARIEESARKNRHAKFGLDFTADWSASELAGGALKVPSDAAVQPPFSDAAIKAARGAGPLDWVELGAVTTPTSQGRCGTCAQFSATADIEAQWFLAGNGLVKLSEQEMIDCSSYTGPYGMGWVSDIHKGITDNATYGLANHSDPTLAGCRSNCSAIKSRPSKSVAFIDGATCAGEPAYDNQTQMLAWLQYGPLSVSIDASFGGYQGGVLTDCNHTGVDHAVLLVGWGHDKASGLQYWKLKNSWGVAFGEGGYVRMQKDVDLGPGQGGCLGLRGACQAFIGNPPPPTGLGMPAPKLHRQPLVESPA